MRNPSLVPANACIARRASSKTLSQSSLIRAFSFFVVLLVLSSSASAQRPGRNGNGVAGANLIRAEYYAARDFFDDGQIRQAYESFEVAYDNSRNSNNERGIDSIPPVIMMGESLYEMCDIGRALEMYDIGLKLSLDSQRWVAMLQSPPGIGSRASTKPRDINWNGPRNNQLGNFSDLWTIPLGSNDLLLELPSGAGVAGKPVSVDALEVLRCQAIALRRRWLLLGPLAVHHPLTGPLAQLFGTAPAQSSDSLASAMNVCHALALLSQNDLKTAKELLTQNVVLKNGFEHPLSAIALLSLSDIAIAEGDIKTAREFALDATVAAAKADHMDHLQESIEYLAKTGIAIGNIVATDKAVEQIQTWAAKRSRMVTIRAQVELARIASSAGNTEALKKICSNATAALLPEQIAMPRAEAVVQYSLSRGAFLEGNISRGLPLLEESLLFLSGSSPLSNGAPRLFQLNLVTKFAKEGVLTESVSKQLLMELLQSPSPSFWRVHPHEQIVWLSADKSESKALLHKMRMNGDLADQIAAVDQSVVDRFRQVSALSGRILDVRTLFHGSNRWRDEAGLAELQSIASAYPLLLQNANKMSQTISSMAQEPKWDMRRWHEEDTRRWDSLLRMALAQESQLWAAAIGSGYFPELFPPKHDDERFRAHVRPDDAVVMFSVIGDNIIGFVYQNQKWKKWTVEGTPRVEQMVSELRTQIVASKKSDLSKASGASIWAGAKAQSLRKTLFPDAIWKELADVQRLVIVPDSFLWNIPYGMLPLENRPDSLPSIASRSVCLVPSLGLIPFMLDAPRPEGASVQVHSPGFITSDSMRHKVWLNDLAQSGGRSEAMDLGAKGASFPPSRFLKIAAKRVVALGPVEFQDPFTLTPVRLDSEPVQSQISSWNQLPWGMPNEVWLPGVNAIPAETTGTGNEWMRLSMSLIAQGNRSIVLSHWPVGGESTGSWVRSMLENRLDESVARSLQRATVALWEERIDGRTEPVLDKGAVAEELISGEHPIFWAGYFTIGDAQ